MQWGVVCSVPDPSILDQLEDFGHWLVDGLELEAQQNRLAHQFESNASFVWHCSPGDRQKVVSVYEKVCREHPGVFYVIHILPKKNSIEFVLLKELTVNYAIIGQGVLVETALSKFGDCAANLSDVFQNMNQYIARRLSQICCYRREENTYKLLINGTNPEGILTTTKDQNNTDVSGAVEMVLHSVGLHGPEDDSKENLEYNKNGGTVQIQGFPTCFNKFQVAALVSECFRPLSVLCIQPGKALVHFANQFHAAQVMLLNNGKIIENEGEDFIVTVKSVCPTVQKKVDEVSMKRIEKAFQKTLYSLVVAAKS
uniref:RRM domain-containing protein n=1 Tax=Ditylenchus dipsaci TaxID=166011 RepID=A0A915DEQ8_9BILA